MYIYVSFNYKNNEYSEEKIMCTGWTFQANRINMDSPSLYLNDHSGLDRYTKIDTLLYGKEVVELELKDEYYNMGEKIKPVMHIVEVAERAMKELGITPITKPIRGGTDGSQLSFMGLPCPNIFAGGHNFHGKYEFVPVENLEKATEVIIRIAELVAKK